MTIKSPSKCQDVACVNLQTDNVIRLQNEISETARTLSRQYKLSTVLYEINFLCYSQLCSVRATLII
jgi:hypothetical protein